MEDELDRVEDGKVEWHELLAGFYPGFKEGLEAGEADSDEIIKESLAAEGEICDQCGKPMWVKWTADGRFLGCSAYPECEGRRSMDGIPPEGLELGLHPGEGRPVRLRTGRYGPYVELQTPEEDTKPKRVSLPENMSPSEVDLEYAVKLLELPRTVGEDPGTGEEIVAGLGRYGPFVRRGKTFATLKSFDAMWTVTLEEALDLINAKASGQRQPLKELGKHPDTGQELVVFSGRWGPYIKHEKVNVGLPKGTEIEEVTLEMALDLLKKKKASRGKKKGRVRSKT